MSRTTANSGSQGHSSQLKSITVENFKGIADGTYAFGPVTLISGSNESGKSSLIDALTSLLSVPVSHWGKAFREWSERETNSPVKVTAEFSGPLENLTKTWGGERRVSATLKGKILAEDGVDAMLVKQLGGEPSGNDLCPTPRTLGMIGPLVGASRWTHDPELAKIAAKQRLEKLISDLANPEEAAYRDHDRAADAAIDAAFGEHCTPRGRPKSGEDAPMTKAKNEFQRSRMAFDEATKVAHLAGEAKNSIKIRSEQRRKAVHAWERFRKQMSVLNGSEAWLSRGSESVAESKVLLQLLTALRMRENLGEAPRESHVSAESRIARWENLLAEGRRAWPGSHCAHLQQHLQTLSPSQAVVLQFSPGSGVRPPELKSSADSVVSMGVHVPMKTLTPAVIRFADGSSLAISAPPPNMDPIVRDMRGYGLACEDPKNVPKVLEQAITCMKQDQTEIGPELAITDPASVVKAWVDRTRIEKEFDNAAMALGSEMAQAAGMALPVDCSAFDWSSTVAVIEDFIREAPSLLRTDPRREESDAVLVRNGNRMDPAELEQLQDDLKSAEQAVERAKIRSDAIALLREVWMKSESRGNPDELLSSRVSELLQDIGLIVRFGANGLVEKLTRDGSNRISRDDVLSTGTREQIETLARLAYAVEYAKVPGRFGFFVMDDGLIATDEDRFIVVMNTVIQTCKRHGLQLIVASCHARVSAVLDGLNPKRIDLVNI